jgi:hypothetical protein
MAADNHTTIIGNLVEDPEVRFTQQRHRRHQPPRRRHPARPAGRPVARRRHQLLQGQRVARQTGLGLCFTVGTQSCLP